MPVMWQFIINQLKGDNMHKHCHCEHKRLKFCSVCNVVYCEDCGKEWNDYSYNYGTITTSPNTTWGTGVVPCSHV